MKKLLLLVVLVALGVLVAKKVRDDLIRHERSSWLRRAAGARCTPTTPVPTASALHRPRWSGPAAEPAHDRAAGLGR